MKVALDEAFPKVKKAAAKKQRSKAPKAKKAEIVIEEVPEEIVIEEAPEEIVIEEAPVETEQQKLFAKAFDSLDEM